MKAKTQPDKNNVRKSNPAKSQIVVNSQIQNNTRSKQIYYKGGKGWMKVK